MSNCGSCGNVCNLANSNEVCTSGNCYISSCLGNYLNCDSNHANGCEKNGGTDESNCGSCGNVCNLANATEICLSGSCNVSSCSSGYGNCDGNHANGCETNTNTSEDHCGSCGNDCSVGQNCVSGSCQSSANLRAQYKTDTIGAVTNTIRPKFKIYNDGSTTLALTDIKIRYWFTDEPAGSLQTHLDNAAVGNVSKTTGGPASRRYLEVGFYSSSTIPTWVCGNGASNQIQAGCNTGEIQMRFNNSSWQNFTQYGDHSFSTSRTTYANWSKVTVYYQGSLVWGTEP